MAWVYAIPIWLFALIAVAASTSLASAGLILSRRLFPVVESLYRNDVAGPTVATLGSILAVVLSFMAITVWQEYDQAAATVQTEANALCNLYRDASTLPEPLQSTIESSIARYIHVAVDREWPLMRRGSYSSEATLDAAAVLRDVAAFKPKTSTQEAMQTDMIGLVHVVANSRRERLFDNSQAIPNIIWATMLFISTITIASAYLFYVTSLPAHVVVTGSLAAVIAAILVLIGAFDLPFRGDIQIPPAAFASVFTEIAAHPPNSKYLPNAPRSDPP